MYTATSGLMFDTPEDAERAAKLLNALFEQARAREASADPDSEAQGDVLDRTTEIQKSTRSDFFGVVIDEMSLRMPEGLQIRLTFRRSYRWCTL